MGENQISRKPLKTKAFGVVSGTHGRIRTSDLPLRRRPLYPAELRGHIGIACLFYLSRLELSRVFSEPAVG